jgi:hypothetical protein
MRWPYRIWSSIWPFSGWSWWRLTRCVFALAPVVQVVSAGALLSLATDWRRRRRPTGCGTAQITSWLLKHYHTTSARAIWTAESLFSRSPPDTGDHRRSHSWADIAFSAWDRHDIKKSKSNKSGNMISLISLRTCHLLVKNKFAVGLLHHVI